MKTKQTHKTGRKIMDTPYLIQRLTFKTDGEGAFDDVLRCDYMGSAEFEFGALPKSLKQLTRNFGSLKVNFFKKVKDYKNRSLCIIADSEKADLYFFNYINELACNNIRLKETSRFQDHIFGEKWNGKALKEADYSYVDAWWDIENHIIFTFSKNHAKKILKAIENTLTKKKINNESEWY